MDYAAVKEKLEELYPQEQYMGSIVDHFETVFADEEYDNADKISELFRMNKAVTSRSQFYRLKRYIISFYKMLAGCGEVADDTMHRVEALTLSNIQTTDDIQKAYFADLRHLLDYVNLIGSQYDLGGEFDQITLKSILILTWYGFETSEIVGLRQSDIRDGRVLRCDEMPLSLPDEYFKILQRCASTVQYRAFPSGKRIICESSPYLLKASSGRLSPEKIKQLLKRFNVVSKERLKRTLALANVKRNGVFCALYLKEESDGCLDFGSPEIKSLIGSCNPEIIGWYRQAYAEWKSHFYGGAV